MNQCQLPDRRIVEVAGLDAEALLNRLFTNSMLGMRAGGARYAALLSPQGKLLFDFLVYRRAEGFWIDLHGTQVEDFTRKLTLFRLRADVTIELRSDLVVAAAWDGPLMEAPGSAFRDPRHDGLGYRIVAPASDLAGIPDAQDAYKAHRILLGIPEGGVDFVYGDAFVHEANLDLLHGVDFEKGCYVGQEVVSRVHHRNAARKRMVRLEFHGDAPAPGASLAAGTLAIGDVTSVAGRYGLATARIDRLAEAEETSQPVLAGETLVSVFFPAASAVRPPSYAEDVV
jgi:tRNA-modifying protein YgfZ